MAVLHYLYKEALIFSSVTNPVVVSFSFRSNNCLYNRAVANPAPRPKAKRVALIMQ